MASVEINPGSKVGVDKILKGIAKLSTEELDQFRRKVNQLWESKNAKATSEKEKKLLRSISQPLLNKPEQLRYDALQKKRESESLADEEIKEFNAFVAKLEKRGLVRLESIVELSKLKGMSVDDVLRELNMTLPFPEHA